MSPQYIHFGLPTIALLLLVLGAGCVTEQSQIVIATPSGQRTIQIEIADNPLAWQQGLMGRTSLAPNTGMLFVFPDEAPRRFWMKNTLIPLDIIFISAQYRVVDIVTMQPCQVDSCPSYTSQAPAQYVLEVNANYTNENRITINSTIGIQVVMK